MRTRILFISLMLFSVSTYAQKSTISAKQLLEKTSLLLESDTGAKIKFNTEFVLGADEGETQGVVWMKGDQFVIETEQMKTWFDGLTQWSLIYEMEEVNIIEPTESELLDLNPYWILKTYRKGYSIKLGGAKEGLNEIVLTAQKKSMDLQTIHLWINPTNGAPKYIEVHRKDKSLNKIKVLDLKLNEQLTSDMFKFNAKDYPTVEEIDLR